jgi:hypothetical protein
LTRAPAQLIYGLRQLSVPPAITGMRCQAERLAVKGRLHFGSAPDRHVDLPNEWSWLPVSADRVPFIRDESTRLFCAGISRARRKLNASVRHNSNHAMPPRARAMAAGAPFVFSTSHGSRRSLVDLLFTHPGAPHPRAPRPAPRAPRPAPRGTRITLRVPSAFPRFTVTTISSCDWSSYNESAENAVASRSSSN